MEMLGDGPSLTVLLIGFLGLGAIGFLLSLFKWWASIPIILFLCFWGFMLLFDELYASDLYPVYSTSYPFFLYSATATIVIGPILPFVGMGLNFCERLYKGK